VIRQFGYKAKLAYSLMFISMEEKKSGISPLCNPFSKNTMEERITAIMNTRQTTRITLVCGKRNSDRRIAKLLSA
jgi:bla regulator protein BlaR1